MTQQEKTNKIHSEFVTILRANFSEDAAIECVNLLCDYLAKENEKQQHWKRMAHWQQIKERTKRIT